MELTRELIIQIMKRKSGVLVEKLIEDPRFLDVEFMVHPHQSGDCNDECGIVVGSSVLLAAGSDYFSTLFNGQWREGQTSLSHEANATKKRRRVDVHQASVEAFRQLLHFVYTGELPSEIQKAAVLIKADEPGPYFEQALLLWELADRYGVVDVKPALNLPIRQFIAKQDMITVLQMTHTHAEVRELCEVLGINFEKLFRADQAFYSIPEHLEHIRVINELKVSSPSKILDTALQLTHARLLASPSSLLRFIEKSEFNSLPFETVKLLFSLDLPLAEIEIFNAIDKWWQHDPTNRTEQAESLAELVRTDFLSYADLIKQVEPSQLFDDYRLKEAFKFVAGHSRVSITERSSWRAMKTLNFSEAKCFLKVDHDATRRELSVSLWLAKSSPRKSISRDDVSLRVYFGRKLQPVEWPSEETSLSTTKPVEWTFDFQREKHWLMVTCFLCLT